MIEEKRGIVNLYTVLFSMMFYPYVLRFVLEPRALPGHMQAS
jgi:hypothetical protein